MFLDSLGKDTLNPASDMYFLYINVTYTIFRNITNANLLLEQNTTLTSYTFRNVEVLTFLIQLAASLWKAPKSTLTLVCRDLTFL